MFETFSQMDPAYQIMLAAVLFFPALLVARFILFMILPRSWLKRYFCK